MISTFAESAESVKGDENVKSNESINLNFILKIIELIKTNFLNNFFLFHRL